MLSQPCSAPHGQYLQTPSTYYVHVPLTQSPRDSCAKSAFTLIALAMSARATVPLPMNLPSLPCSKVLAFNWHNLTHDIPQDLNPTSASPSKEIFHSKMRRHHRGEEVIFCGALLMRLLLSPIQKLRLMRDANHLTLSASIWSAIN